jgi:DNA-binding NarL/FixJ family response regulator
LVPDGYQHVRDLQAAPLPSAPIGPPRQQPVSISPGPLLDPLTPRELEVLRLVAQGLTDAQVAEQLIISERTVHSHLRSVYSKLGVSSRTAATRCAIDNNLIE